MLMLVSNSETSLSEISLHQDKIDFFHFMPLNRMDYLTEVSSFRLPRFNILKSKISGSAFLNIPCSKQPLLFWVPLCATIVNALRNDHSESLFSTPIGVKNFYVLF